MPRIPSILFQGLIIASSLSAPVLAADSGEAIGRVILTTSNLEARGDDGSSRALHRSSPIYEGDTLVTGAAGLAQVRLNDGALISLRRNTEFKIQEFRFNTQKPAEDRGFFALLRGGFRTITGLIGKRDTSAYKVNTSVATIGIRGTHYGLRLCQAGDCQDEGIKNDGLYGGVVDGRVFAENNQGSHDFGNDQYFFVANANAQPQGLLAPPAVVFGSDLPEPDNTAESDSPVETTSTSLQSGHPEANQIGNNVIRDAIQNLSNPIADANNVDGSSSSFISAPEGVVVALALLTSDGTQKHGRTDAIPAKPPTPNDPVGAGILLTSEYQVVEVTWPSENECSPCNFHVNPEPHIYDYGDTPSFRILWGRWGAGEWGTNRDGVNSAIPTAWAHFVVSPDLTTPTQMSSLTGTLRQYDQLIGNTLPTDMAGRVGQLTDIVVDVNFTTQTIDYYSVQLSFDFGAETVSASNYPGSTSFSTAAAGDMPLMGGCSGGNCGASTALNGTGSVNFIGETAAALMSTYALTGTNPGGSPVGYNGAAVVGHQ